jgi:hypothetical protein
MTSLSTAKRRPALGRASALAPSLTLVSTLMLMLTLSGCAAYTPRVGVQEMPTLSDSYLYGRLFMDAPKTWLALDGYQTMGFSIQCSDGTSYVLRFDRDDPVVVIKVRPATCSWQEVVYSDADGAVRSRKPAPPDVFKNVVLDGGYSYYLGDFHAQLLSTLAGGVVRTEWKIKAIRDNYEYTTEDMLKAHPNLKALPTENRMILRKHDGPKGIPNPKGVGGSIAMIRPVR